MPRTILETIRGPSPRHHYRQTFKQMLGCSHLCQLRCPVRHKVCVPVGHDSEEPAPNLSVLSNKNTRETFGAFQAVDIGDC